MDKAIEILAVSAAFGVGEGGCGTVLCVNSSSASSTSNRQFVGTQLGWIRERSVPTTEAVRYLSAVSTAQIPVPVPMSRIL